MEEYSVEQMKNLLRLNNLTITGTKSALAARIAEAKVLGCIPKCSECGGGRATWDDHGYWVCNGYMDDDTWQDCSFVSKEVIRVPWKDEDGDEEEEEEKEELEGESESSESSE